MKDFTEAEKNFLTCAVMLVVCGVGLLLLNKQIWGIISLVCAVIFFACPFVLRVINKNKKEDEEDEK